MKILIIIGSFKTGGAERMTINTGEELSGRGHDVYYVVQRPVFEIPNSISEEKIIVLRKKEKQTFMYKITSLIGGVFKAAQKINPDVVIGFSRFSSLLACFTFKKNIIARFDVDPFILSRKNHVWANIVLHSPYVKKIVIPTQGMKKVLQKEKNKFRNKFHVIPNSIEFSSVLENAKTSIPDFDFPYISAMGRLCAEKNFELLISAFSKSKIKERFKLIIIGDGALRSRLEKLVDTLGLKGKVIFTGQLKNPYPIISKSHFFINTSNRESFCNVILEALALAKPVIATNCNYGPSDMIDENRNGFLVPTGDVQSIVKKLNYFADNPGKVEDMAQYCAESTTRFHIGNIGEQWEEIIQKVYSKNNKNKLSFYQ